NLATSFSFPAFATSRTASATRTMIGLLGEVKLGLDRLHETSIRKIWRRGRRVAYTQGHATARAADSRPGRQARGGRGHRGPPRRRGRVPRGASRRRRLADRALRGDPAPGRGRFADLRRVASSVGARPRRYAPDSRPAGIWALRGVST